MSKHIVHHHAGLNRKDDYGSSKKPYSKVAANNFAGAKRSYPIPTKADAIDALRLAGLHHRPDIKSKVYSKYPSLKHKMAYGGINNNINMKSNKNNKVTLKDGTIIETINGQTIYTYPNGKKVVMPQTISQTTIPETTETIPNTIDKTLQNTQTTIPNTKTTIPEKKVTKYGNGGTTVINKKLDEVTVSTNRPKNILVPNYNGTYVDSNNVVKNITLDDYRKQLALNPNFGKSFEASDSIPNTLHEPLNSNNFKEKPKYFIGSAIQAASLGLGIVNSIMGNNAQKKQIEEQNRITDKNNSIQLGQRLDSEGVSGRNFSVNTPMTSFYANGGKTGIKLPADGQGLDQQTEDMIVAKGATHEQGGVDMGDVEVEGGGAQGNKPGEVIKQEPDGSQFVFSNRIPIPGMNTTFAQVAQQLTTQKANLEKSIGLKLIDIDNLSIKLNSSNSIPKANSQSRLITTTKNNINKLESNKQQIDLQIEALKEKQLEVGKQQGLYNEDGTPKDTSGAPMSNEQSSQNSSRNNQEQSQQGEPQMKYGGTHWDNSSKSVIQDSDYNIVPDKNMISLTSSISNPLLSQLPSDKININPLMKLANTKTVDNNTNIQTPTFLQGVDRVLSSNAGQAVMGAANAGINFMSNLNAAKNLERVKLPSYIPIKNIDTPLMNLSASRADIIENQKAANRYAVNNYANPQVANIMSQQANTKSIEQLAEINQQEQNANIGIINQNISRRMGTDATNTQAFMQNQEAIANKTIGDINNRQGVAAGLNKDLNSVLTNYRQGILEDKTIKMYESLNPHSVNTLLNMQNKYGIDMNEVNKLSSDIEKTNYLRQQGVSENDIQDALIKMKSIMKTSDFGTTANMNVVSKTNPMSTFGINPIRKK